MKLHILSDLHTELAAYAPPEVDADVVILAGDVGVGLRGLDWIQAHFRERPVIYVAGNHEYYGHTLQPLMRQLRVRAQEASIHFLENEAVEIGGYVFLGCTLWTDFELFGDAQIAGHTIMPRMSDFDVIRVEPGHRRLRYADTIGYHRISASWLAEQFEQHRDQKVVVVTHHAPSSRSLVDPYKDSLLSAAFASRREDLVADSGALLWAHGHVHSCHDYQIGPTRVVCNSRGYPGEGVSGFDGALVLSV